MEQHTDTESDRALIAAINAAHAVKHIAIQLQEDGFDPYKIGDMRKKAEACIKAVHEYQAYINVDA